MKLNIFLKSILMGAIILSPLSYLHYSSNKQVVAQSIRRNLPMTLAHGEGEYQITVPDTNTTKSAFGGKLRVYDLHIAKMFEVTYADCQEMPAGYRIWYYYAGNGNINMGAFHITCELATDIVAAYGLGAPQTTVISYSQEEAGPPEKVTRSIPTLNLVGGKEEKWVNFAKQFKPISQ